MVSAQEHGMIVLKKFNQATKNHVTLKEQRSEILGYVAPTSRTNPQEQDEKLLFMEGGLAIDEKEIFEVWFEADAADIIESEESKFHVDVTIVDKKSGRELPSSLNFENITGFTVAGAVDLTHAAGQSIKVGYKEIPAGQQIILGRKDGRGKCYCYFGDDTA